MPKQSTQTPEKHAFTAGDYVRNGSSRPGLILELVELKPGYPKAWVRWEGGQFPVAEDPKDLKIIEPWALDWRWNKENQLVRLHDNKKCHDLEFIVRELELAFKRLAQARSRKDPEDIKDKQEKIAHLKDRKAKAIVIDEQFQSLIPPLSAEEKSQLEENLKENGCRDPIVVWGNILIDGHNRFDLCKKNKLDFQIEFVECVDRSYAHDWIIKNQLGRRNLSPEWMANLRGQMYISTKSTHGGDRKSKPKTENSSGNSYHLNENMGAEKSSGKTAKEVATQCGVTEKTIRNDAKFAEAIDKICHHFGQEWRSVIIDSKLTKTQTKEIAKHVEKEECYEIIESLLDHVYHKDRSEYQRDYKTLLSMVSPKQFEQGQLVKLQFTHKSGLTEVQKHCEREFGIIVEVLEHSYKVKLLKDRELQVKAEDLQGVPVVTYCVNFSAEEFEKLCDRFGSAGEIEEEIKNLLLECD
ncbi:MAG: hypothetical protein QNJ41_11945 [Xenococcaceae cyanobacterium MO_188.B32]|nr:hypothetical protein [Xenococcaceae cyanobacterium MO_188.B32]